MVDRTIGQKVGQWILNIKTLIALLVTTLPLIGGSVAYFQYDNIKSAVSEPKIEKPIVENAAHVAPQPIATPPPVKDYDLIINELIKANKVQNGKISVLSDKINKLEAHSVKIDSRFGALKTWVGWKE